MKYDTKSKTMDYSNKEMERVHGIKYGKGKVRKEAMKKLKVTDANRNGNSKGIMRTVYYNPGKKKVFNGHADPGHVGLSK